MLRILGIRKKLRMQRMQRLQRMQIVQGRLNMKRTL